MDSTLSGVITLKGNKSFATAGATNTFTYSTSNGYKYESVDNFHYEMYDNNLATLRHLKSIHSANSVFQEVAVTSYPSTYRLIMLDKTGNQALPTTNIQTNYAIFRELVTGRNSQTAFKASWALFYGSSSKSAELSFGYNEFLCESAQSSPYGYAVTINGSGIDIRGGGNTFKAKGNSAPTINGNAVAFVSSSAKRYKHNIKYIEDKSLDPHKLLELPIIQFEWNENHTLQYKDMRGQIIPGIIAEDVARIYPSAVIHNDDGEIESWDERRIIPGMLALIQEQDKKLKEQEKEIEDLKSRLEKLERAIMK